MHGQITSYSSTSLVVDVTTVGGSGTLADWTIRLSGPKGPTGSTGSTGAAGSDGVFSAIASQAEAEGGTENTKGITALRAKQAVDSYGLIAANDLSDVASASTARTNLGLAIGTNVLAPDGSGASLTGIHKQGLQTIFVPSMAMRPTSSNGCAALTDVETTSGRPDLQVLDFDASSDEHAQFQVGFPKSWNSSTVTFRVFWTSTATDTDGVSWGLQGVSCADGDSADVVYGTAIVVDDANQSTAEDIYITATSSAVTIAGSPSDDELVFFRVFRDVSDSNDTAAEDARLVGVQLFFTTNAADDS
jgi:hypothetical protein